MNWKSIGHWALTAAPVAAAFIPGVGPLASTAIGAAAGGLDAKLMHRNVLGGMTMGALAGYGADKLQGVRGARGLSTPDAGMMRGFQTVPQSGGMSLAKFSNLFGSQGLTPLVAGATNIYTGNRALSAQERANTAASAAEQAAAQRAYEQSERHYQDALALDKERWAAQQEQDPANARYASQMAAYAEQQARRQPYINEALRLGAIAR